MNMRDRLNIQESIHNYIDFVLAGKTYLTFEDFQKLIKNKASDLLLLPLMLLHERLPCAINIFRLKRAHSKEDHISGAGSSLGLPAMNHS
jgi:hypothetical protein